MRAARTPGAPMPDDDLVEGDGDGQRGDDSLGRSAALDAVIGVGDHLAEE